MVGVRTQKRVLGGQLHTDSPCLDQHTLKSVERASKHTHICTHTGPRYELCGAPGPLEMAAVFHPFVSWEGESGGDSNNETNHVKGRGKCQDVYMK